MQRRGQLWFAAQFVLFGAILVAPLVGRFDYPLWLHVLGLIALTGGIIVAVLGYRTLGSSHSPWTTPIESGHLVTTGIYHFMRHPIMSAGLLLPWAGRSYSVHRSAWVWRLRVQPFDGYSTTH